MLTERGGMANQTLTAVIHEEDGIYVADCIELGTVSQGATVEEALANLREASSLFLAETSTARTAGRFPTFVATFSLDDPRSPAKPL